MDSRPQDIPVKKLINALLAIAFGTIIEWVRDAVTSIAKYSTSDMQLSAEEISCNAEIVALLAAHCCLLMLPLPLPRGHMTVLI
jgi:hypothetical protein